MSLAYVCAWSFRADAPQYPRPAGAPARIGSIGHKLAEVHVKTGTATVDLSTDYLVGSDPSEVAAALELFSPPVKAFLDATKWTACEIGIRYDSAADAAVVGPRRGEPGYEDVSASVLPGTLDLVHVDGELATIVDLKTGKLISDVEQLHVQSVAVSRLYPSVKRVRAGYAYMRKTKCDDPKWVHLDADALDEQAGRIARLLRTLPTAEPNPGDHCWRCEARPGCPAYGADATALEAARVA